MAKTRGNHLRVVRDEQDRPARSATDHRADYWSQVQTLRAEQRRLRAG
ncbi:hypothetical protein [Knoellia koreensis]|uniref:Uncharacterized protein n=1 Tax=Knoellia koreensis TaxID=2730921 RepID=A0A849HLH8_9MICO|nr:hypothetical protein [Knoellia sp. DB2414S]NNM47949.1 hypothetical protein [Knoellia sp. DB2414S]